MKNSKSVTYISRSVRRWGWVWGGWGMEQRKCLDQYLTSGIVSTRSIQRFKRYPILQTFNRKLQRKISMSVTLASRLVRGWGWCIHGFKRYRFLKTLTKNFNILSNSDADADANAYADAVVTAIALPALSYRRAKNIIRSSNEGNFYAKYT